jgi:hypothetical protein
LHGQDAIVIGLGPREDHGSRRQTLVTPKLFAGFQFEVNLIGTFVSLEGRYGFECRVVCCRAKRCFLRIAVEQRLGQSPHSVPTFSVRTSEATLFELL